jgi:peptide/nickel transport system substrate-binding protein
MKQMKFPAIAALLIAAAIAPASAQQRGGVINVATIGEPPTLDPMVSSTDIVGMIGQHIFETLFTFDKDWKTTPLLADGMPSISPDGKIYTIKLRQGVMFHDGQAMTSADVVASLKRWAELANRGKQVADNISAIEAVDPATVRISLKEPYAPLLALLAFNNSAAVILPAGKQENPLKEAIGTGPYKVKERKPDQYLQLARFDAYKSPPGESSGYGGARNQYVDEIRFVPVPDANTRVEGALSGQFTYTDSLPIEAYPRLKDGASEPVILAPFGWPMFVMNSKEGLLTDQRLRKAVQIALNEEDMLAAAFGDQTFYSVNAPMYPKNFVWHSKAGAEPYNIGDPDKAKTLLKEAGYDGQKPLRIVTSRQYEFHYKMALVAAEYLKQAGFNVAMDVVDWATLVQRIRNPALWEIFITHSPFLPEPALISILSPTASGWWNTPAKNEAVAALNSASTEAERVKLWEKVQALIFAEAPLVKIGDFNSLSAKSTKLQGFTPSPWPAFWNVSLKP